MSGSFNSPVPQLTSAIPVPASVLSAHPNPISTSILSGTISLSTTTIPSSSPLLSSSVPQSVSSSTSTISSPITTTSSRPNAAMRQSLPFSTSHSDLHDHFTFSVFRLSWEIVRVDIEFPESWSAVVLSLVHLHLAITRILSLVLSFFHI
ncbi:hypothetical protein F5148DRAFT_360679 [Russula earlei]|uniref:Uncharacterized protein n=1 Tax=Russula earlei TaxID=71964 RepID=A0ACC0UJZ0_9AGAM|nr:hypothetical protein F5148DRAFT_360679 [Russula earlei]